MFSTYSNSYITSRNMTTIYNEIHQRPAFGVSEIIALFFIAIFYFLPLLLGLRSPYRLSVILINIFFGWTIIGWWIALMLAITKKKQSFRELLNSATSSS